MQHFEDASEIFEKTIPELQQIDGFGSTLVRQILQFDSWNEVDRILEQTENCEASLVALGEPEYPVLLSQIYDPPPVLWLKGNSDVISAAGIAVIGTRNPDSYGLRQAEKWTKELVRSDLVVNSGLAYGIDSTAHKTAVDYGGKTVAVLGSGIDWIYPARNANLVKQILEQGGAMISEFPPGAKPDAVNFPVRNRIVSGMSLGVMVIQSGIKGGSMITARSALDQNREVFVIPHDGDNLNGIGGNYLIKTGQGKLIQDIEDLLDEISYRQEPGTIHSERKSLVASFENLSSRGQKICGILENGSVHLDKLAEAVGQPSHELFLQLIEMEMKGIIRQKAGKYYEINM